MGGSSAVGDVGRYFRYSYASGTYKHTYRGISFREFGYTKYKLLWLVEQMDLTRFNVVHVLVL
jgi:hypothetical protein